MEGEMCGKKILILEDNEATAELIKFYLQEEGFITQLEFRGKGFIDKVVAFEPDLISIDILLPDFSGIFVCQQLIEDERTRNIPFIFISVKESEKENVIRLGAKGFIGKPINEKNLKKIVGQIFREEKHEENTHC
jgi:DNA-binding response OmpR family regulator